MFKKGEIISITYIDGESEYSHNPLTETINDCVVEEFDNGLLKVKRIIKSRYSEVVVPKVKGNKEIVQEYVFNIRSPIFAFSRK